MRTIVLPGKVKLDTPSKSKAASCSCIFPYACVQSLSPLPCFMGLCSLSWYIIYVYMPKHFFNLSLITQQFELEMLARSPFSVVSEHSGDVCLLLLS